MQQECPTRPAGPDPAPLRAGSAWGVGANGPSGAVGEATARTGSALRSERGVALCLQDPLIVSGSDDMCVCLWKSFTAEPLSIVLACLGMGGFRCGGGGGQCGEGSTGAYHKWRLAGPGRGLDIRTCRMWCRRCHRAISKTRCWMGLIERQKAPVQGVIVPHGRLEGA